MIMNELIDHVPDLWNLSRTPLPLPGTYKVTKEGYRIKGTKSSNGTQIPGYSVIIRKVVMDGQERFIRWKIHQGTAITMHPDYIGFRNLTDFNPVKPRKLLNREVTKGGGAIFFREPRPERKVESNGFGNSNKDDDGRILWKTAKDIRREDESYEDDFGIDSDNDEDREYPYSQSYRDYKPSANPFTDQR